MAQPPQYRRATDFAGDERNNAGGRSTVRTDRVSAELDALGLTANTAASNLGKIQRDDLALRDGIVTPATLSQATILMLGGGDFVPRGEWLPLTAYAKNDLVEVANTSYVALSAHISSVSFAVDRALGLWQLFPGQPSASTMPFAPTADIEATNVQAAIEEVRVDAMQVSLATLAFNYGGF